MKKQFIFCLSLITGLFAWSFTAFASDNVRQVIEAQHEKSAAFSKLFISIIVLLLFIAIGRALFLFLYYKDIFGVKEAFRRILFHPRSLNTTNVRDLRQNAFLSQFKKAISVKAGQNIAFGLDTNILMHYPNETFELLKNERILISREVQKELDGLKKSTDKETAANARRAFKALEDAQTKGQSITILPSVDHKTLIQFGLSDTMDDRILAAYLQLYKQGQEVCFLSNDRGAKITARNTGIPVIDVEQSATRENKNSWTGLIGVGVIVLVLLVGIVGYNAYSFFQANSKVGKSFSDARESLFDKGKINTSRYGDIIESINEDSSHIYNANNVSQFIEPTQKGNAIIHSLAALTESDREPLTTELREILQPLAKKYYPSIDLTKLDDESIQTVFYYGQKDIRFGLIVMNWNVNGGNDVLEELLAIDSSSVGLNLFESYNTMDEVKYDLIDVWNHGPFRE